MVMDCLWIDDLKDQRMMTAMPISGGKGERAAGRVGGSTGRSGICHMAIAEAACGAVVVPQCEVICDPPAQSAKDLHM